MSKNLRTGTIFRMCLALVEMARYAVPARVVAGEMKYSSDIAIRKSCAAARGADIVARCPYHAKHIPILQTVKKQIPIRRNRGASDLIYPRSVS